MASDSAKEPTEGDAEILVVLLDTAVLLKPETSTVAASLLQQLVAFLDCFLLLNAANELAVFAVHPSQSPLLFRHEAGSREESMSLITGRTIYQSIAAVLRSLPTNDPREPSLSAALSRGLCYLNAKSRQSDNPVAAKQGRILVIHASPDAPRQYVAIMNGIFAAQRSSVLIDAVHLGQTESSFLQQSSHLTGGVYIRLQEPMALFQSLSTYFASPGKLRQQFVLERNETVHFMASCVCHERAIDVGFACSICLSIFCSSRDACSVCGEVFAASH